MSADNRLCIMEWGGGGQWFGWHGSLSDEYHEPPLWRAEYFHSESDALAWADKEAADTYLEGGISRIGVEEQESALIGLIEDASRRLVCLRREGRQYPQWNELP